MLAIGGAKADEAEARGCKIPLGLSSLKMSETCALVGAPSERRR